MRLVGLSRLIPCLLRKSGVLVLMMAAVLAATSGSEPAAANESGTDPAVISDWNATAVATIVTDAGKNNAEAFCWYAFTQAAVYNAVVGITGRYELYNWDVLGPRGASPEAAAAAAAHRLLLYYFPNSQGRLNTALSKSLAQIPDGSAKDDGIWYGQQAADRIIHLRKNDRSFASISFNVPLEAGVWRPTPPGIGGVFRPVVGTDGADAPHLSQPIPAGAAATPNVAHLHRGV